MLKVSNFHSNHIGFISG